MKEKSSMPFDAPPNRAADLLIELYVVSVKLHAIVPRPLLHNAVDHVLDLRIIC